MIAEIVDGDGNVVAGPRVVRDGETFELPFPAGTSQSRYYRLRMTVKDADPLTYHYVSTEG